MRRSVLVRDNKYPHHSTTTSQGDMEALNVLKGEHSAILSEVYELDKQLTSLESSGPIKGTRILRELAYTSRHVREDVQQHTAKEERGLFPVLEARLGKDRELVQVMKHEHEELLATLEALTTEVDTMVKDHDTRRTWNLVSRLQELKGELSDHLSKEERVLFWLAELRLSWLDQKKISSSLHASDVA